MAIDIGAAAIDRASETSTEYTYINKENPANASGIINSVEVWTHTNITEAKVGIFYTTNGDTLKCRSAATIGAVTAGAKRTFEVSLAVESGDYIGIFTDSGQLDWNTGGAGVWSKSGNHCVVDEETSYTAEGGVGSLYGTGVEFIYGAATFLSLIHI